VEKLPIEYDPVEQVWRYRQPVVGIEPTLVSEADRRAILFSLQGASQLENTPFCEQARRMYKTLLASLPPESATQFEQLMARVRFTGPRLPTIASDVWDVMLLCLEAHDTMHMTYTGGINGTTADRDIDPYGLMMRDRHWILVGYCHLRKQVLTFAVHRITKASTTDRPFELPPRFMDDYLANAFDGFSSTDGVTTVVLRIKKDAPLFIADRLWSENESRTRDRHGRTMVTFDTSALFMVEREVRADGGWVEVLKPVESRMRLRGTGQAVAAAHE